MQKKPSSPLGERSGGLLMLLFAIAISLTALFLPPPGVIDPSVLWIVAQALLFTASVLGIDSFSKKNKDE